MLRLLGSITHQLHRAPPLPLRRLLHSSNTPTPPTPHFKLLREVGVEESGLHCSFYEHEATGAQVKRREDIVDGACELNETENH